jgi:hypothetical protein
MIDWAAKWFEVRAEIGQSDVATLMYKDGTSPITQIHFHHRTSDGFGIIQNTLKNEGININPPTRSLQMPSAIKRFFLLFKGLALHPRVPHNPWKNFSLDKTAAEPSEVSFWFLSQEENILLKTAAENARLSLGFFILSELDQIIRRKLFRNPMDSSTWLYPVDMRGAYKNPPLLHNFVSFVPAIFSSKENVQESFQNYKHDLKSGLYWAFWELAQIGKYVGVGGIRWLSKQGTNKAFWMGSFTDIGTWNQHELQKSHARDRYWVIGPPGSHSYPVGISTIEWCSNRSITVKIHPGICGNQKNIDVSDEILNEFKQIILAKFNKSSEIPAMLGD